MYSGTQNRAGTQEKPYQLATIIKIYGDYSSSSFPILVARCLPVPVSDTVPGPSTRHLVLCTGCTSSEAQPLTHALSAGWRRSPVFPYCTHTLHSSSFLCSATLGTAPGAGMCQGPQRGWTSFSRDLGPLGVGHRLSLSGHGPATLQQRPPRLHLLTPLRAEEKGAADKPRRAQGRPARQVLRTQRPWQ